MNKDKFIKYLNLKCNFYSIEINKLEQELENIINVLSNNIDSTEKKELIEIFETKKDLMYGFKVAELNTKTILNIVNKGEFD